MIQLLLYNLSSRTLIIIVQVPDDSLHRGVLGQQRYPVNLQGRGQRGRAKGGE